MYREAMEMDVPQRIYLTEIKSQFECDTFLPPLDKDIYKEVSDDRVSSDLQKEGDIEYVYKVLEKKVE